MQFLLGVLAYVIPTFILGYVWHLVAFKNFYDSLEIYRDDVIIPFGIVSMLIQAVAWSYVYRRLFAAEGVLRGAAKFAAFAAPLAWSFMVIAVAAKHRMSSVSDYVLVETAFFVVQYAVVSPLIALAFARSSELRHGV